MMGVSGAGKSTVGRALSERLGWSFVDGDEYHSAANVAKMSRGEPLDDADRAPWLVGLHHVIEAYRAQSRPLVLACSALKASYRDLLVGGQPSIRFVHLRASPALIGSRLADRPGHYMPASLLASQLETLEPPSDAVTVDADRPVEETVDRIVDLLGLP